jgi:hypothetical protein
MDGFDKVTYFAVIRAVPPADRQLLRCAQSLGLWSAKLRQEHFEDGDGRCPHCGANDSGVLHEVWQCSAFRQEQTAKDVALDELGISNTPAHILLGMPSKLDASIDEFFFPFLGEPLARPTAARAPLLYFGGRLTEDAKRLRDEAIEMQKCNLGEQVVMHATQCTGPRDVPNILREEGKS